MMGSGALLHGAAVAVWIAKEDERASGELLNLADLHPTLLEFPTRGVYVRDDELHSTTEPGCDSTIPLPMGMEQADPGGVN